MGLLLSLGEKTKKTISKAQSSVAILSLFVNQGYICREKELNNCRSNCSVCCNDIDHIISSMDSSREGPGPNQMCYLELEVGSFQGSCLALKNELRAADYSDLYLW